MRDIVSSIIAVAGTSISAWFGGWDVALQTLVFLMVFDYITGVLCGIKNKKLNSDIMFWGGIRKSITMAVIALAVILDELLGNEQPIFRTLAIYFYIGREGLSVLENLGILGVAYPKFIQDALEQLNKKGEEGK